MQESDTRQQQHQAAQDDGNDEAMSESTSEHGASVAGGPTDPDTSPSPGPSDDRRLKRLLMALAGTLAVLIVVFGVVYYLGQRTDAGPTMSERAVAAAEQAVKENPNDIGLRLTLATAYESQGMLEEARTQYQEVLKFEPDHRTALLGLATILYGNDDLEGAKAQFQHVVDVSGGEEFSAVDPQLEKALYFLGAISLTQKDYPTAIKHLEAALKIDATDADAWYTVGRAQAGATNYEKAAAAYLEALRFIPSGWCEPYDGLQEAYTQLKRSDGQTFARAMSAICKGDVDAGTADLEKVTEGEFQVPALLGLGQAAEAKGDTKAAIGWYRKVRDLEPTNVPALSALARLGDTDTIQKPSPTPDTTASSS
jgi:tetratricopeptide (TPR) repeat protein